MWSEAVSGGLPDLEAFGSGLIGAGAALSGSIGSEKSITSIGRDVFIAGISSAVGSKVGARVGRSFAYKNFKSRGGAA